MTGMKKDFEFYQKQFQELKTKIVDKKSLTPAIEVLKAEVDDIVAGGKKGLEVLKQVGKKPEKFVEENHQKFTDLKNNIENFFKGLKK